QKALGLAAPASRKANEESAIRIFISHASVARELAELVADLLRTALRLSAAEIRCTSVDGYRLGGGADPDEQLRPDLRAAHAVVGILPENSAQSPYVLIELGGRWLIDRYLLPPLAPGAPPTVIGGPLARKNALHADSSSQLHQMVEEVAGEL